MCSFHEHQVWESPRGTRYRVMEVHPAGRAILRRGEDGSGKKMMRPWDSVSGWALVGDPEHVDEYPVGQVSESAATRSPSPAEIRAARIAEGLSKPEAAALVHVTRRAWDYWESGRRKMGLAHWELFLLKAKGWMASDPEGDPE